MIVCAVALIAFASCGIRDGCTGEEIYVVTSQSSCRRFDVGSGGSHGHVGYAVDISKAKLYPDKKGTVADFQPMSKFCGTKPIKVALSDGWGGNYWRHITRAEFEDEASKCKNITDARYTDGEFKPEKQIADIEGLIAQKYRRHRRLPRRRRRNLQSHARGDCGRRGCRALTAPATSSRQSRQGLSRPRHREPDRSRRAGRGMAGQDAGRQGQHHHVSAARRAIR